MEVERGRETEEEIEGKYKNKLNLKFVSTSNV